MTTDILAQLKTSLGQAPAQPAVQPQHILGQPVQPAAVPVAVPVAPVPAAPVQPQHILGQPDPAPAAPVQPGPSTLPPGMAPPAAPVAPTLAPTQPTQLPPGVTPQILTTAGVDPAVAAQTQAGPPAPAKPPRGRGKATAKGPNERDLVLACAQGGIVDPNVVGYYLQLWNSDAINKG